jgi:hypothetical protein
MDAQMLQEWQSVETEGDAARLRTVFGDFHDGCLREAHVWSETYVSEDLSMAFGYPCHLGTHVRLLFQRQWRNPSAIELLFDQVIGFHVVPPPENYGADIWGATLFLRDGIIYWSDNSQWRPDSGDRDESTWIGARRLRWRDASAWMGEELRYGPRSTSSRPPAGGALKGAPIIGLPEHGDQRNPGGGGQ